MLKKLKIACLIIISFVFILIATVFVINFWVEKDSESYLFNDLETIPKNEVGLVLGTSKYLKNGNKNLFFFHRIDAASALYKAGKIKFIIVSGDNSNKNYNEPEDMRNELILRGVSPEDIYLDYAGLRTLDSVVRSKEIFGQTKVTIISQKFHNERAVFIAHNKNIEAIGFNAKEVSVYYGFKTKLREKFARIKVFIDLFLINKSPKYLGEKVHIGRN